MKGDGPKLNGLILQHLRVESRANLAQEPDYKVWCNATTQWGKSTKKRKVIEVGGLQLIVDEVGTLESFFPVYVSKHTKANVLSFTGIEDMYKITYVQKRAFIVHMHSRDLVFNRRQKLYVVD
jgi:hypothetical protein